MQLRIGVIGLGERWESRYRPALAALSDRFEVRAVYAPVALLAENGASKLDANTCEGYRSLLVRPDIDAVLILSCDWLGTLPAMAACEYGKAIFAAADLDWSLEETLAVRCRVEQSGVAYVPELPRRLAPATIRLKELIATRLGPPRLLFCHERVRDARERSVTSTGMPRTEKTTRTLEQQVDWVGYVVGSEPAFVTGIRHCESANPVRQDYQMMSLDFSSPDQPGTGPVAQISCSRYIPTIWPEAISFRPPSQLQVCCEHGLAYVELPATLLWFDEAGRHLESMESERPIGESQLMQLHRAVTSLVRLTSDLDDTLRAREIVARAQESSLTGRRITLRESAHR